MTPAPLPEPVPPAARERVVEVLTRHFAADGLTEADLEARLQRVYAAASVRELDALLADLPAQPGPATAVTAFFSGQERKVTGVVPRELRLRARLGHVELDLTHATFEPGLTTIDVRAFMGYVQIRLPAGIRVESAGRALFGYFSLKGGRGSEAQAASVVRITGRAALGFAEAWVVISG